MKEGKVKTRWEDSHAAAQKTTNGATADDLIKRIGAKQLDDLGHMVS